MTDTRRHYFPANDRTVVTYQLSTGRYRAYLDLEHDEIEACGYGATRYAAIADLVERIGEQPELR